MCTFLTSRPRRRAPDALGEGKPKSATYPAHAHRCRSAVFQTFLHLPPVPAHSAQSYECVLRGPRRHDSNIPRSAPRHRSASPRAVEASSLPHGQMGKPQLTDAEERTNITPHWTAEKGLEPSHLTMSPGSSQGPTDTEATSTRAHLAV